MTNNARRLEFGIAIPQIFPEAPFRPALIREFVTRAEAVGLHSLWVQEQMLGSTPVLDPIELLTYAGTLSTRMKLGTAVLLTVLRSPVHLAKSLATLDQLSEGRLIAGVGLGAGQRSYPAYGISADARVARFTEGLKLMNALWTERVVTFKGRFFTVDGASMEPKPVQQPRPPLWFGAHHPDALRRAIALGDGFIGAGSSSPAAFKDVMATLRSLLAEAGRDPATFPVSKRVYVAVDADRDRAARRLASWFGAYYGRSEMAERVSIWGEPQECAERLREIAGYGAELLILNPVFDPLEQLERLTSEVIPRVTA